MDILQFIGIAIIVAVIVNVLYKIENHLRDIRMKLGDIEDKLSRGSK